MSKSTSCYIYESLINIPKEIAKLIWCSGYPENPENPENPEKTIDDNMCEKSVKPDTPVNVNKT